MPMENPKLLVDNSLAHGSHFLSIFEFIFHFIFVKNELRNKSKNEAKIAFLGKMTLISFFAKMHFSPHFCLSNFHIKFKLRLHYGSDVAVASLSPTLSLLSSPTILATLESK